MSKFTLKSSFALHANLMMMIPNCGNFIPQSCNFFCTIKFDQSQPKLLYTFRKLSTTVPPNDEPSEGHKNSSSIPDVYSFVVPTSNLKRTFDGICIHKSTIGLTAKQCFHNRATGLKQKLCMKFYHVCIFLTD